MSRLIACFSVWLAALSGCAVDAPEMGSTDRVRAVDAETGMKDGRTSAGDLICSPVAVAAGDAVIIALPDNHGSYLQVRSPDGTIFMLAFPSLGDTTAPQPLYAEESFHDVGEVNLPASVHVEPWNRSTGAQAVFARPGRYTITAGENLESDADYPSWDCTVEYLPSGSRGALEDYRRATPLTDVEPRIQPGFGENAHQPHSARSAIIGSTVAALRAGRNAAQHEIRIRPAATTPNVTGSCGLTP